MPDIGKLRQISQGEIRISSVTGAPVRPASVPRAQVVVRALPKLGAIRGDAELIHQWHVDERLVRDKLVENLPEYSTTARTIVTGANLTPTVTLDYTQYNYYTVLYGLAIPIYNTETKRKGRCDFGASVALHEIVEIPAGEIVTADGSTAYTSRNVTVTGHGSLGRELYWTSATGISVASNVTYGAYVTAQAPSVSSGVMTCKAPNYGIRGNTSQMTSAAWAEMTDIREQWILEVYRAPKGDTVDGWGLTSAGRWLMQRIREHQGKLYREGTT